MPRRITEGKPGSVSPQLALILFAEFEDRLLMLHGMGDENVQFQGSFDPEENHLFLRDAFLRTEH
jgi:hypothetical protein